MWLVDPEKPTDICIFSHPQQSPKHHGGCENGMTKHQYQLCTLMSNNALACGSQNLRTHKSAIKVSAPAELSHTIGSFVTGDQTNKQGYQKHHEPHYAYG